MGSAHLLCFLLRLPDPLLHELRVHTEEGEFSGGQQGLVLSQNVHRHQAGGAATVAHPGVRLDLPLRLVAQEVEGAGLGDVIAAIGVAAAPVALSAMV